NGLAGRRRGDWRGFRMQGEGGGPGGQIRPLEIAPADAVFPPRPDRLHPRLFRGEASGVALEAVRLPLGVGDLRVRIDALDKSLAVACDSFPNPTDFSQIDASAQDHYNPAPEVVIVSLPCLTPLVLIKASAILRTAPALPRTTSTSRQLS